VTLLEAYLSAEEAADEKSARFFEAHENVERSQYHQAPPFEREEKPFCVKVSERSELKCCRLNNASALPESFRQYIKQARSYGGNTLQFAI
jgi:hypothetical protein